MSEEPESVADCMVCEKKLYKSPTKEGWTQVHYRQGVCWDCIDSLHASMTAIKKAIAKKKAEKADGP